MCVCVCNADKNQQCLNKSDLKLNLSTGSDRVDPDQTLQNVLSGYTLFATHSTALKTSTGGKTDLYKF